jgi:heme exporter protein C
VAGTEHTEHGQTKTSPLLGGLLKVRKLSGLRVYLVFLTGLLMLANLYLIFMEAPTDADTGHVQRVMYLHVPLAVMSFLAFLMVFVASIAYLARREAKWDSLAHASAEVGVVFISLALITGMIWAKPIWNAWWLWTPRLTTTLILWLIYAAYLMVRAYAPSRAKGALYGAVMGIIGFADVIIVYFSVQWWPGIHPEPVIGPQAAGDALDPTMRAVLLFSFATFFFLLLYLVVERMALRKIEDRVRDVKLTLRRSRG